MVEELCHIQHTLKCVSHGRLWISLAELWVRRFVCKRHPHSLITSPTLKKTLFFGAILLHSHLAAVAQMLGWSSSDWFDSRPLQSTCLCVLEPQISPDGVVSAWMNVGS